MPFGISRAPYKVKMPSRPRRATSKVEIYSRSQLQAKAKDKCGDSLDLLPPHHHQTWIAFHHDGREGQKQMYIGDIMNGSEKTPVFVNMSVRGTVRFRCADGKLEDHAVRNSLQPKPPFELVPQPALDSLIIYYFVMAGQYPHFVHVPNGRSNLAGLKLACQAVEQVTAKPSKSYKAAKKNKARRKLYREAAEMLGLDDEGFQDSPKGMAMQQENEAEMKELLKMFVEILEY